MAFGDDVSGRLELSLETVSSKLIEGWKFHTAQSKRAAVVLKQQSAAVTAIRGCC
jgi:hypothetical protein